MTTTAGKQLTKAQQVQFDKQKNITNILRGVNVQKKFEEVLGKGANGFIGSLLSVVTNNKLLLDASPQTIMTAAMQAATLNLPINPNLGLAYIVPYKGEAQFQLGWKGFVQLAERTGQYKTINASVVYEGQIEDIDFITGELVKGKRTGDTVIGYVAYIEMLNGFQKTFYMTKEEVEQHARKYSQSYQKGYGPWKDNFDAMALKTVLKLLISKYGIMSIDMQTSNLNKAMEADQAVIRDDGTADYVDNRTIDAEPVSLDEAVEQAAKQPAISEAEAETPAPTTNDVPMPDDDEAPGF